MSRVGLFGGTFDPPHNGHLAVAQAAAQRFRLDRVLFAPTGLQPLKLDHTLAPFADRVRMVELLIADDPRFSCTLADAPHPDGTPNFATDLIQRVRSQSAEDAVLFNIVGIDAFAGLPRWHQPERLLTLCDWIVVGRPGSDFAEVRDGTLAALGVSVNDANVYSLPELAVPVSATSLRMRLERGEPCSDALPPAVVDYIRSHRLYGSNPADNPRADADAAPPSVLR